ncbi:hypothetical protein ACFQYP_09590 [Nonomuraea antimicrobica]
MTNLSWSPARRQVVVAGGLGALVSGAAGVAGPAGASAAAENTADNDDLITRTVPGTKELLPAIGLGTFQTFDTRTDRARVQEVVRRYWQAGGRVFDCSPCTAGRR